MTSPVVTWETGAVATKLLFWGTLACNFIESVAAFALTAKFNVETVKHTAINSDSLWQFKKYLLLDVYINIIHILQ